MSGKMCRCPKLLVSRDFSRNMISYRARAPKLTIGFLPDITVLTKVTIKSTKVTGMYQSCRLCEGQESS